MKYIMVTEDCTLNKAFTQWNAARIRFSSKVYEIMQYILQKEQPMILLNRNPTLNYYSMLLLKIRSVKRDFNDYTLSVPLAILPGLNADFDGDVLNIIGLMNAELKYIFRKFNPVERMIMSRDSGLLNDYFSITKGQLIDLLYFAICDKDAEEEAI